MLINTGILGQLANALMNGETNFIEELVEKKITDLGKDAIRNLIGSTSLGIGLQIVKQLEGGGGANEFKRMRDAWLNSLQPTSPHSGLLGRINNNFQKEVVGASQETMPSTPGKWTWSKSRREWLDESWKHNWRSQPRDSRGRWIKGRLNTIYISQGARKARNKRRRLIRKGVREIMRGD